MSARRPFEGAPLFGIPGDLSSDLPLFDPVAGAPPPPDDPPASSMEETFGPVIYAYTRAQAIEDGTLADVTEWASASKGFLGGFTKPVAMTAALWGTVETIPTKGRGKEQDIRGRAHDVLWMASLAVRGSKPGESRKSFSVLMDTQQGRRTLRLVVDIGPGDEGEPVFTIGYPEDF